MVQSISLRITRQCMSYARYVKPAHSMATFGAVDILRQYLLHERTRFFHDQLLTLFLVYIVQEMDHIMDLASEMSESSSLVSCEDLRTLDGSVDGEPRADGLYEERFRVDRRKLESMLLGKCYSCLFHAILCLVQSTTSRISGHKILYFEAYFRCRLLITSKS